MRKIILSMCLSIMTLFVIWTSIAYYQYGSDIIYHHLNLQGMFIRIKNAWVSYNIYDLVHDMIDNLYAFDSISIMAHLEELADTLNWNWDFNNNDILHALVRVAEMFVSPVYGIFASVYIPVALFVPSIRFLITALSVILECLAFVFNPLFI